MGFDPDNKTIIGPEGHVRLTPRETELLECLAERAGKTVPRDELLACAWGWSNARDVRTKTVDVHIGRLRGKLECAGLDPGMVQTVRYEGYRLRNTEETHDELHEKGDRRGVLDAARREARRQDNRDRDLRAGRN